VQDADVVAQALALLLAAVDPRRDRGRQDDLRLLAQALLDPAPHHLVEELIGADDGQVGLERVGVVALEQRVDQLVGVDIGALLLPAAEHLA
jgi:hypothetical protein